MPSVCFYFQVHQPYRLRQFSYFDSSGQCDYFDDQRNGDILRKVAHKSYLPTNALMLDLINRFQGKFRISYSISGVALEQFERYSPETLETFKRLVDTGCVEILGETYYHSLASVYDEQEFFTQIDMHRDIVRRHFGVAPKVFRNTELIYQDHIGYLAAQAGFRGILSEGADDVLGWRSPNFVYSVPGSDIRLLMKNYRLSDDIAFRFSNSDWDGYPLTADKFAHWVHAISGSGELVNLFMDYETFGEHQWEYSGIFDFLEHMPDAIVRHPDWDFCTVSEAIDRYPVRGEMHVHRLTSWADIDRDLTAWRGNRIQQSSLEDVYALRSTLEEIDDPELFDVWRKLQTSDHFYYMCTKWCADGDVHAYFSPFDSPYDAFINYMNVFRDFERTTHHRAENLSNTVRFDRSSKSEQELLRLVAAGGSK